MGSTNPELLPLLRAVHGARLFWDSKTIVDMHLMAPAAEVATAFRQLALPDHPPARRAALLGFVSQWLAPVGSDLDVDPYGPSNSSLPSPPPSWLPLVHDPAVREWARELHRTWGALARAASPEVRQHPERHSLLWVPHPFVTPGARFRETYYWDSLWVVKGLLACNLTHEAAHVVTNLVHLVEQLGFVPNGNRTYYLNRSQPPLLSKMVHALHAATHDEALLRRALPALVREHGYWTTGAKGVAVQGPGGQKYHLSRYCAEWDQPRPESYREDVETAAAAGVGSGSEAERDLYRNIASAAESGWDFSSRWLLEGTALPTARTTSVVPADLSAFLYRAERNIAAFAEELGEVQMAERFALHAERRLQAITALHWDPADGQWRDLVIGGTVEGPAGAVQYLVEQSRAVFASNWVPLWCGCAAPNSPQAAAAVASLKECGLVQPAGVAASLQRTGQQWDWPNAWPPLQSMLIEGCQRCGGDEGASLARDLAQRYLASAYAAWKATGRMFEKFDCTAVGAPGGGGEYECVDGFGWTNGVALQLLNTYGWPTEHDGGPLASA